MIRQVHGRIVHKCIYTHTHTHTHSILRSAHNVRNNETALHLEWLWKTLLPKHKGSMYEFICIKLLRIYLHQIASQTMSKGNNEC